MPPVVTKNAKAAPLPVRDPELENSRLGVIYFLANLRVDFSAEGSGKDLQKQAVSLIAGKLGTSGAVAVAKKVAPIAFHVGMFALTRHVSMDVIREVAPQNGQIAMTVHFLAIGTAIAPRGVRATGEVELTLSLHD